MLVDLTGPVPTHGPRERIMRLYEVVDIPDPALLEDAVTAKPENFHERVTFKGGEDSVRDHVGTPLLASPVPHPRAGGTDKPGGG